MNKSILNPVFAIFIVVFFVTMAEAQDEMISEAVTGEETAEFSVGPTQDSTVQTLGTLIDSLSATQSESVPQSNFFNDDTDLIDPDFLKDEGKAFDDFAKVTVRILDKITADTRTYDLEIGKTVAYGPLRLRPMACKKSPPIEEPESASFLQIWEKIINANDKWIFSGWMFASSPSLSAMEHPVYDVWIIDCKD